MHALEKGLYDALTAALSGSPPAGGVHLHPAPQGTGLPVVTFQPQAIPRPARTLGGAAGAGHLAWRTYVYLVRVTCDGDSKKPAADLLDTILAALDGGAGLTVQGWTVMRCEHEGGVEFPESVGGETYHHVGGLFRIQLTP